MGSSVSSERAFSSAGITISKRRNRLKGDIVEALQFMKSMYQKDLLLPEKAPTSLLEIQLELEEEENAVEKVQVEAAKSWDSILLDVDTDQEDDDEV